ncbi:hypothetical protein LR48_Vigan308s000100 [Vigna angularis]|uniref:Uncharacterized protein n=1 Tax=Phaseolus angularis TaxID=3914 RepID=A0A0L9T8M8_PHAAN|nr:hypothetical protein LR48_Vigan308s000100 [Vigna angularis]
MASDGCDPPIPPLAKSDKEKGKKKSYMVKLLNRFNNVNASSSQPSTPTSTSTARFVPPPLQVPGLTPTPPSIPPSLEVPAVTPSPQQFAVDQWRSPSPHVGSNATTPSPHVGSNPTTPTNMPSPPPIGDNPPHSSSAANDFEDVSNNRPIITPIGGGFYPTKTTSKAITATIKQQFDEPWVTWGQIPQTQRDAFFEHFKGSALTSTSTRLASSKFSSSNISSSEAPPSAHIHTEDHCNDRTNVQRQQTTQGKRKGPPAVPTHDIPPLREDEYSRNIRMDSQH